MKKKKNYRLNKPWEPYVFLAPWLLGLFGLTLIPMVMSLYYSFTDFDMFTPPRWVGFQNYINIFTNDPRAIRSMRVTFTFVALTIPFQLTFALILAVVLRKNIKGVRTYRAVYYLPSLLGGSIAISILWRQIFNQDGLVNQFLALVGIEGINWIAMPQTALYTIVFLAIWQFGASMVIFLGGLKQISQEYYEAAEIDGAGKLASFFRITLPLLTPMIFFNIVMGIINAFQAFTPAFIISGGTGRPLDSTLFYTLYLYIRGFTQFAMGYASALAWLLVVFLAIATALMFLGARKWVFYDE